MPEELPTVPVEWIEKHILLVRGRKVMLDSDLAEIYGVTTKALNQAVKRNRARFPEDFMFQLSSGESAALRSQSVTSKRGRGGRRYAVHVFTEHGAVMLATVLRSPVAVRASVQVVRAFIRLREILAAHKDLARKLAELERAYDRQFAVVFEAIRQLMGPPEEQPKRRIGFRPPGGSASCEDDLLHGDEGTE